MVDVYHELSQPQLVLRLRFLLVHRVPREVVEHVAVLEDLEERRALVLRGALDHLLHVLHVAVDRASDAA